MISIVLAGVAARKEAGKMSDILNRRVYERAVVELTGVDWDGYPYGRLTDSLATVLKEHYFLTVPYEEILHDSNWAFAEVLGCGCEEESY